MKFDSGNLIEFFKSPVAFIFLLSSLVISPALLSSNEFFSYLYIPNEEIRSLEKTIKVEYIEEKRPSFSDCCINHSSELEELLDLVIFLLGIVLIFPTCVATALFIFDLQNIFPDWSSQTFEVLTMVCFIFFNSVYWLFLAYILEKFFDGYSKNRPKPKAPFSIFSKI